MAEQKQREIKLTRIATYHEIYANISNVRVSNWDFLFEFGKVENVTDVSVEANSEVGIYMSPQQFKAFVKVCEENLAKYEKSFGVIAFEPK